MADLLSVGGRRRAPSRSRRPPLRNVLRCDDEQQEDGSTSPGEILNEEFLKPTGLSHNRLANDLRVPPRSIDEIAHGRRRMTADTALRLPKYFKMSPEFWLGLQMDCHIDVETDRLADRVQHGLARAVRHRNDSR